MSLFRHEDEHGVPGSLEYQSLTARQAYDETRVAVDYDRAIGTNSNLSLGLSVVNHVLDYEDDGQDDFIMTSIMAMITYWISK